MADIELVIKIDKGDYRAIKNQKDIGDLTIPYVFEAIRIGKPLPKGHGKLVDINSVPKEDRNIAVKLLCYPGTIAHAGVITLEEYINNLPAIIAADEENK